MSQPVQPYAALSDALVSGGLLAHEYMDMLLALYLRDPRRHSADVQPVLDELFYLAEDFVADPALRDDKDLDDDAFVRAVAEQDSRLKTKSDLPIHVMEGIRQPDDLRRSTLAIALAALAEERIAPGVAAPIVQSYIEFFSFRPALERDLVNLLGALKSGQVADNLEQVRRLLEAE